MGEVVELVLPTTAALSALACARGHYLIRRRCRRVGPDWYRNVVWRQNIYCHRRTGWLSNDEPAMMTGAKGPPTSHMMTSKSWSIEVGTKPRDGSDL
jgi:hypothetical protein